MRLRRSLVGLPVMLAVAAVLVGTVPVDAASRKVTLGVTVENRNRERSSFNRFTSAVDGIKPRIWTLWSQWGSSSSRSFPTDAANWVRQEGAVPLIFWEPYTSINSCQYARFSQVARGDHDGYIRDWARAAAAHGGTVLLRYAHEINGAYFPWGLKSSRCGNSIADYKAAWKHIHGIFRSVGADNVKFLWTVSRGSCRSRGCNPYKPYYPGNAYVDYVGFSVFNWGRHSGHRWQSMPSLVGSVMPKFKQFTRKPVVIAELATNKTGGNKPAWIRKGYQKTYKRWPQIKAIVYLNVNLRYLGHPDWSLGSPSGAYRAYEAVASQARFEGRL
jgi:hypothetical protein